MSESFWKLGKVSIDDKGRKVVAILEGNSRLWQVISEPDPYEAMPKTAFWLWPRWDHPIRSDNLRDPGSEPFWVRSPNYAG
jgi:hypothetical protein